MSQQVRVERDLVFEGAAANQPNVKGPMMTELKIFDELFVIATSNDWSEQESYGSAIAAGAVDGGSMVITCNASADTDVGELSHTAQWSAASNCGMEAKVKLSQITDVGVAIGFVDAREATDGHIAGELDSSADLRDPTVTADAALMIFDTDGPDFWYYAAINNNGIGTPIAAFPAIVPVEDTFFKVRVQTDSAGQVTFFYNGVAVGRLYTATTGAIAFASTNLLTPYVGFISRSIANPTCTISRITTWQDC